MKTKRSINVAIVKLEKFIVRNGEEGKSNV